MENKVIVIPNPVINAEELKEMYNNRDFEK